MENKNPGSGWNKFLKPDRRKIITLIILISLVFFLRELAGRLWLNSILYGGNGRNLILEKIASAFWLPDVLIRYITFGTENFVTLIITAVVLQIFYWYFFACVLVFIYERLRNRK